MQGIQVILSVKLFGLHIFFTATRKHVSLFFFQTEAWRETLNDSFTNTIKRWQKGTAT